MKKLFYGLIVAVALSTTFGLILRTKGVSYAKQFQWTVENLDDLPDEYESDELNNGVIYGYLALKTDIKCNTLEIYFSPLSGEAFTRVNMNGTVTFKNSTNYVFGVRLIRKTVTSNQEKHLLTVDISNVFGKDSLSEVYKMLNNFLVMDFSMLLTVAQSGHED